MQTTFRLVIILIISCFGLTIASAQKYNSFVGFRYGLALPMGQFASTEFSTGGYALRGRSIKGEAAWFISPKLGFGVDFSSESFVFASGYYVDDFVENEPSYKSVQMLSSPYILQTYMGGVYYRVTISSKFYSTFKLMGGLYAANTPDQFFGVVDNIIQVENFYWKTSSFDRAFGVLTGASLEYSICEHLRIIFQADFSYADLSFGFYKGEEYYTKSMKTPILQLLPGINIHF